MTLRITTYALSLDEARNTITELRTRIGELEQEITEVNDERNQLITEELFASREQFTSKGYGQIRVATSRDRPARALLGHSRADDVTRLMPEPGRQLRRIDTP